jgi:O-antigen/teichoic acid export membrane protein
MASTLTDPTEGDSRAKRLAVHTVTARAISYLVALPGSIMLARALGAADRGIYQLPVTTVTILVYVSALGVPQALFRLWSPERLDRFRRSSVKLTVLLGGAGVMLGLALFELQRYTIFDGVPTLGFVLVVAALPALLYTTFAMAILIYVGGGAHVNVAAAVSIAFQSFAFVVLGAAGALTVTRTCLVYLLGSVLQALWLAYHLHRVPLPSDDPDHSVGGRRLIGVGVSFQPYVVANFLLLRLDVFFLAHYSTSAEVGRYAVAVTLTEIVWNITDAIGMPATERASASGSVADDDFRSVAVRMTLLLGTCAAAFVALTAPLVIPLLYGSDFSAAGWAVVALAPGVVMMALWRVMSLATLRFGHPAVQASISIGALALNAALNVALDPNYGALGAAAASSIAYTVAALATTTWVVRRTRGTWLEFVPRRADLLRALRLPARLLHQS